MRFGRIGLRGCGEIEGSFAARDEVRGCVYAVTTKGVGADGVHASGQEPETQRVWNRLLWLWFWPRCGRSILQNRETSLGLGKMLHTRMGYLDYMHMFRFR